MPAESEPIWLFDPEFVIPVESVPVLLPPLSEQLNTVNATAAKNKPFLIVDLFNV
jgi:hypothetical protein